MENSRIKVRDLIQLLAKVNPNEEIPVTIVSPIEVIDKERVNPHPIILYGEESSVKIIHVSLV